MHHMKMLFAICMDHIYILILLLKIVDHVGTNWSKSQ